jgi:hypothetical protein
MDFLAPNEAPGEGTVPLNIADRLNHTIVEVIDPEQGVLVARSELPFKGLMVSPGFVGRLRTLREQDGVGVRTAVSAAIDCEAGGWKLSRAHAGGRACHVKFRSGEKTKKGKTRECGVALHAGNVFRQRHPLKDLCGASACKKSHGAVQGAGDNNRRHRRVRD